jgi:hypothetical protein
MRAEFARGYLSSKAMQDVSDHILSVVVAHALTEDFIFQDRNKFRNYDVIGLIVAAV